jgi:hypothetical protein
VKNDKGPRVIAPAFFVGGHSPHAALKLPGTVIPTEPEATEESQDSKGSRYLVTHFASGDRSSLSLFGMTAYFILRGPEAGL